MPVFLGLAGVVLALLGDQVLASRWSPAALAATHFIVLRALAPVMCGALLQIAPVLLGAPYPRVRLVAGLTGAGLALGSIAIGSGFWRGCPPCWSVAACWLGWACRCSFASFRALRTAAVAEACDPVDGTAGDSGTGCCHDSRPVARVRAPGLDRGCRSILWVDARGVGLAGWIGLLSFGIGMQLIPLFYDPPVCADGSACIAGRGRLHLTLMLIPGLLPHAAGVPRQWFVGTSSPPTQHTIAALWHEQRRQRPRHDANLYLWQASHISLLAATALWLCDGPSSDSARHAAWLGTVSFIVGALLKIVPFLSWLDLQQRLVSRTLHGFSAATPERVVERIAFERHCRDVGDGTSAPVTRCICCRCWFISLACCWSCSHCYRGRARAFRPGSARCALQQMRRRPGLMRPAPAAWSLWSRCYGCAIQDLACSDDDRRAAAQLPVQ